MRYVIVGQQQGATAAQSQQVQTPPPPPAPPSPDARAQLREQIRARVLQEVQRAEQRAAAANGRADGHVVVQGDPAILIPPQAPGPDMIPPQAVDIALAFFIMIAFIVVGLPLARAFARRLDRKPAPSALDPGLAAQLQRIEHTVESMSIEVERISEAQRYMARLQSGNAEPASLPSRGPGA
jgi:hypothetical protein